jgi:hypothetical protein
MDALVVHLRAKFPDGHWEKLLDQDVPRALLSSLAWMHEQDAFYMNRRWLNDYLELADDRTTVVELCKSLGYRLRPPSAASVSVRAYPQPVKPVPVVIPKGTVVPYKDTYFEFLEEATVPAYASYWPDPSTTDVIVLTEGRTQTIIFTSDGTPWQEFVIPFERVIEGSLVIEVAAEAWQEVPSLIYVEGDSLGRDTFTGDGLDSQEYQLALLNAIIDPTHHDRLTVMVDGVEWAYVSTFTGAAQEFTAYQNVNGEVFVRFGLNLDGSAPGVGSLIEVLYLISGAQKRYELRFSEKEQPTLTFGDDETGKIPPIGSDIKVTCRVGGGVIGNIDIGELDVTVTAYLGEAPNPIAGTTPDSTEVRLFNYSKGSGGNAREDIEHAKFYAPQYAQANKRAVTRPDWEVLAATFYDPRYGAPAYASAKLHQRVPESNQVDVALWSRDSTGRLTVAGESLKLAVAKFLQSRRTVCTYELMVDGITYYFDVYLAVSLKRNFFTTTVNSQIQNAVIKFFDSALVAPGKDVRINELYRALNQIEGVYTVVIEAVVGTELIAQNQTASGLTAQFDFLFNNPLGQELVPESFSVAANGQTISDDGSGGMVGDADPLGTNSIDYATGKVVVTFQTIPPVNQNIRAEVRYTSRLEWEEDITTAMAGLAVLDRVTEYFPLVKRPVIGVGTGLVLDFYLPSYLMPVVPGRCFFIGGYGAPLASPFGPEEYAYDDGEGNIVGDVDPLATNKIDYRTGRVQFTWIITPFRNAPLNFVGTLAPNADGVTKDFAFSVAGWPGGYKGNVRFDFSAYPTWGVEAEMFANWAEQVLGAYLDNRGDSIFNHASGLGTLHFATPPQSPGAPPHTFPVQVTSTTLLVYSAFVFSVKTPLAPGFDLYLFADNDGVLWGTTPDAFPVSRLTHKTGHAVARLSAAVAAGRVVKLAYDSFLQSNSKNLPIGANSIGTFSRTTIRELAEEIDL